MENLTRQARADHIDATLLEEADAREEYHQWLLEQEAEEISDADLEAAAEFLDTIMGDSDNA